MISYHFGLLLARVRRPNLCLSWGLRDVFVCCSFSHRWCQVRRVKASEEQVGWLLQGLARQLRSATNELASFLILIWAPKPTTFRIVFQHLLIGKMLGRGRLQFLLLERNYSFVSLLVIAVNHRRRLSQNQNLL